MRSSELPGGIRSRLCGDERGYVTAEAAVVVPSLVLIAAMLLWGVMASAAYIQCVDSARAGARAAARGESNEGVRAAVRSSAPKGVRTESVREGELIRVRVRARTPGPGLLAVELEAEAVALAEERVGVEGATG